MLQKTVVQGSNMVTGTVTTGTPSDVMDIQSPTALAEQTSVELVTVLIAIYSMGVISPGFSFYVTTN